MQLPRISVVIPTWNEAERIADTLRHLLRTGAPHEILVIDGQSSDQTLDVVNNLSQQHRSIFGHISPHRGRAAQMNHGASLATGDILLFLHADTFLSPSWEEAVHQTLSQEDTIAGYFGYAVECSGLGYRILELGTTLRAKFLDLPYGDQGIFLRRTTFAQLGGYFAKPLLEDVDLLRRLQEHGDVRKANGIAITSARRFQQEGLVRTISKDFLISLGFHLGVSPTLLARFYRFGNGKP